MEGDGGAGRKGEGNGGNGRKGGNRGGRWAAEEKWGEGWAAGEESGGGKRGKGREEKFFEKSFPLLHGNVQQTGRERGESVRDLGKKGRMAMKDYLSAARRKRFCAGYLRTLDPERAAAGGG